MKKLNFLSKVCRLARASQYCDVGIDRRLTVGSPSGLDAKWKQNPFMRFAVVLTLIFTIGIGNVWGAIASGTYELVTSTSGLVAGEHYIIASGTSGSVYCISNVSQTNYRGIVSASVSNSKITVAANSTIMTFTLGGSAGAWTFYTDNYAGTAGYLASAASGSNNYCRVLASSTTGTISISSNIATIALNPHSTRKYLKYNSGSSRFACYSSGQNDVYLYKLSASCDKKVTIVKGTPETGGSFNLDKTGAQDCCSALTVTVSNITAPSGKEFDAITQSGIETGVTINQSSKTVTYAANSTGTSTINVTFRDLPKYTLNYHDGSGNGSRSNVYEGTNLITALGSPAASCDATSTTFVGWSTTEIVTKTNTPPTFVAADAVVNSTTAAATYYAVYAKVNSGSWSITEIDQLSSGSGYATYNGSHTAGGISYTSNQVMEQSSTIQFQSNAGYIYNTTAMSYDITSIVITSSSANWSVYTSNSTISSTPASGAITISSDGNTRTFTVSATGHTYFHIKGGGSTPQATNITVNYGSNQDYITTCASCSYKVTLSKTTPSNGSFTLSSSDGTYDNCSPGFSVTVSGITPAAGYVLDQVSASGGNSSVTGPDGSGNYTVTYTADRNITSAISVTFKPVCATPTISPAAGTYTEAQTVTISSATGGATIYYTTNGDTPTTDSDVYSTALTVSSTSTIKAIAVKDGYANSEVASATYTIKSGKIFQLVTDASELAAGDELVILGISNAPAYYLMSTTQNGNNRGKTDEDGDWEFIDSENIFVEEKLSSTVQIINLEGSAGAWFLNVGDDEYLYAAGGTSNNHLKTGTKATAGDKGKFAISIGAADTYYATVTAQDASTTKNLLQYNQGSSIFSCYSNAQQSIQIYRYENTSPIVSVGTPSGTSFSYTYNDGPSGTETFTISGRNLTGNVVINAPSNYKIKEGSGSWVSSITLTPISNTIASTTISVQLGAGLSAGSYNGNITFTNNDGLSISPIALTGTVSKADLTPSFGEATYTITRDVSTSTSFTLTGVPNDYTGDITYSKTNSPTASARLTVDGTLMTFTAANYSGRWTVTAQFAADANYNAKTSGVTCTVNAVTRDTYIDNVNSQSVTEEQRTDNGVDTYVAPALSDVASGSACKGKKIHLIGWASQAFVDKVGNGTLTGADSDYTVGNGFYAVGTTLPAATGTTYYAVYGEETE